METTRIASKYSEHVKTQSCRRIFMFVSKINGTKLSKEKKRKSDGIRRDVLTLLKCRIIS